MMDPGAKKRWTINGRFLASRNITGVQRYAREIVLAMDRLIADGKAPTLSVGLCIPANAASELGLKSIETHKKGPLHGHLWEQVTLPAAAKGGLLSLCNTGPLFHGKQIVCIHDLNTLSVPESYSFAFRAAYNILRPTLARRAALVATVSNYSAGQIQSSGLAASEKMRVMPNGHDHVRRWSSPDPDRKTARRDTIVLLGSAAPHKNISIVLALAPELERHGLRIAVVGSFDRQVFATSERIDRGSNIDWLGSIGDAELAVLLDGALCLAFPSRAEGFGLPPLEAMSLGCPVVVSGTTSLPEVCGDAALYASPDDSKQWLDCFLRLRDDEEVRAEMVARGKRQCQNFTWTRSAQLYLDAMASIDSMQARKLPKDGTAKR